jgi:hypothetical protein
MRLTDKLVNSLPSPTQGTRRYHDAELQGFCVQISTAGQRSFALRYRIHGRGRYCTTGAFPTWTTMAARHRAKELRRMIDRVSTRSSKRLWRSPRP